MSDFEVCPVGTLQRLAQVEAEAKYLAAESLQANDEWRKAYCKVEAERDALLEALAWIDRRCPADFLLQDLHKVHLEAAFDAGVCARAAIKAVEGGGNG